MTHQRPKPCDKREMNRQNRRETILTIARELFLANGYAATTMSSIAAALGGSKSTLWTYFPSKAALFEASLEQAIISHYAQMSETLAPSSDIAGTLNRFGNKLLRTATSPNAIALQRLVNAEAGRFPEIGEIFYRRVTNRTLRLLADCLAAAMEQELLRKDDAIVAARIFIANCMSGSRQQLLLNRCGAPLPDALAADVAIATDMLMRSHAPDDRPFAAHCSL